MRSYANFSDWDQEYQISHSSAARTTKCLNRRSANPELTVSLSFSSISSSDQIHFRSLLPLLHLLVLPFNAYWQKRQLPQVGLEPTAAAEAAALSCGRRSQLRSWRWCCRLRPRSWGPGPELRASSRSSGWERCLKRKAEKVRKDEFADWSFPRKVLTMRFILSNLIWPRETLIIWYIDHYPTDPFTILELHDPSDAVLELRKNPQCSDREAHKLWNGRCYENLHS